MNDATKGNWDEKVFSLSGLWLFVNESLSKTFGSIFWMKEMQFMQMDLRRV